MGELCACAKNYPYGEKSMLISRFEKSIVEISRFFHDHKIPYMIIGGIANLFWGEPRTNLTM